MIYEEALKENIKLLRRSLSCVVALVFILNFSGVPACAENNSLIVKGYKDKLYHIQHTDTDGAQLCENDSKFNEIWCMDYQKNTVGIYLGFKQLITYSPDTIDSINPITKKNKWSIPLTNIHKVHLNYPAVVTLSKKNRVLTGYDFFTGFELWQKKIDGKTFFEIENDLWLVSNDKIEKLDPFSSEISIVIPFDKPINKMVGNDIHLIVESTKDLILVNTISKRKETVAKNKKIQLKASDLLVIGDNDQSTVITYNNEVVSENITEDLFLIETSQKKYISFIKDSQIYFLTKRKPVIYDFTPTERSDKIKYAYKTGEYLHVVYENDKELWTLKQIKKAKESDQGT